MLYQNTPQISASKVPGVIFASGVTTPLVPLNNSQTISFLIASGEGTAGNSTITVEGRAGADGTPAAIPFLFSENGGSYTEVDAAGQQVTIGGGSGASKFWLVTISDQMLASREFDRVSLKMSAVASSTVVGSIYVLAERLRYSS